MRITRLAALEGPQDIGEDTDDHGEDESPHDDLDYVILGIVRDEHILKHEVHQERSITYNQYIFFLISI